MGGSTHAVATHMFVRTSDSHNSEKLHKIKLNKKLTFVDFACLLNCLILDKKYFVVAALPYRPPLDHDYSGTQNG